MKTKSFIDLRFFSTGVMGNSVELLFKQCYSLLEGFAWSKQNSYWWSLHPRQWRQHWLQHYNCLFCFSPSWKYRSSILIVLNSTIWFCFCAWHLVGEHHSKDKTDIFKFGNVFPFGILKCCFILPALILLFPFTLNLPTHFTVPLINNWHEVKNPL